MKALIVDDEKHVREAIRLLAAWEQHGIHQILEASDGEEALAVIRQHNPQIVLTDMRMPRSDGKELIAWLSESAPQIKVIVISGYDDFDLVRHTLRYGGMDYILKPVEETALNEALETAVRVWREHELQQGYMIKQNVALNELRPHLVDRMLTTLTSGETGTEQVLTQLREEGLLPPVHAACSAAAASIQQLDPEILEKFGEQDELLLFALINICSEFIQQAGIIFRYLHSPGTVLIYYWGQENLAGILKRINEGIYTAFHRRVHFGLSLEHTLPSDIPLLLQEAEQALWRRNLQENGEYVHLYDNRTIATSQPPALTGWEDKLRTAAMSGNEELLRQNVSLWLEEIKQRSPITPEQLLHLSQEWNWMLHQWGADADTRDWGSTRQPPCSLPLNQAGELDFGLWLEQLVSTLKAAGQQMAKVTRTEMPTIQEIARFVEEHYHQEISLQDISSRFFLSREYISRRFKQVFGITLSDFVVQTRIQHARMLLLNPNFRIIQVAEMVGFQDEKYFSKVFKRLEGVTPNEYRKQNSIS
ncbi:DNA-binding response regulator [Paenibacillus sp. CAA11]|uniref:response regulator n=1 Tax=Paenibacillus sp. CAA11 TaxID=1532905 RepID=UPI000D363F0A|nr:response regulator [Paenibacillus sp. CAA11]AWB43251.1 DNA-binding response regulator [Paenibacillus sp. CAA11]